MGFFPQSTTICETVCWISTTFSSSNTLLQFQPNVKNEKSQLQQHADTTLSVIWSTHAENKHENPQSEYDKISLILTSTENNVRGLKLNQSRLIIFVFDLSSEWDVVDCAYVSHWMYYQLLSPCQMKHGESPTIHFKPKPLIDWSFGLDVKNRHSAGSQSVLLSIFNVWNHFRSKWGTSCLSDYLIEYQFTKKWKK